MEALFLLVISKFGVYSAVCWLAPKHLNIAPNNRLKFSLAWATARLAAGMFATVPLAYLVALSAWVGLPTFVAFIMVVLPSRLLLWWLAARFICERHKPMFAPRIKAWVFLGVCASFTVDGLALLSGANFKFIC